VRPETTIISGEGRGALTTAEAAAAALLLLALLLLTLLALLAAELARRVLEEVHD
jgi:hypothetical protein